MQLGEGPLGCAEEYYWEQPDCIVRLRFVQHALLQHYNTAILCNAVCCSSSLLCAGCRGWGLNTKGGDIRHGVAQTLWSPESSYDCAVGATKPL